MSRNVHVVGTGTIGEPLILMLSRFKEEFEIDDVTFHKRRPLDYEAPKVDRLIEHASLAVDEGMASQFEDLGHVVTYEAKEAIARADVVIDCTPAGLQNKATYLEIDGPGLYIAQGSENGFGLPFARGINDKVLTQERLDADWNGKFVQIKSCNTHSWASLLLSLAYNNDPLKNKDNLERSSAVLIRRANDVSQDEKFVPSPQGGRHSDDKYGTHHARDAAELYQTMGIDPHLFSSAMIVPTQYMHAVHFDVRVREPTSKEGALCNLRNNPYIALTKLLSENRVFSVGRDHGIKGRILNHVVVPEHTVIVTDEGTRIVGWGYTPQDGNSLVSSTAATLWGLHRDDSVRGRLEEAIGEFVYDRI